MTLYLLWPIILIGPSSCFRILRYRKKNCKREESSPEDEPSLKMYRSVSNKIENGTVPLLLLENGERYGKKWGS